MLVQKSPEIHACNVKGCDMTFFRRDQLEWHHKKHEMMLNLSLINNKTNEGADQTPTPTRFIKNCEEVGLFQDLQNVNPFDEIFKKAVDLAKNGVALDVQTNNNSDDSLHTPHILPHITDYQQKTPTSTSKNYSDSEPFDFSTNNDSDSESSLVIVDDDINIKNKMKDKLLSKAKPPVITVKPFKELTYSGSKENKSKHADRIEQIRQMNRAAQVRCRRKKQTAWKEMEEQMESLKRENKRLKSELEALRLIHSKCPIMNGTIMTSVITPDTSSTNATTPTQVPLFIQILPNTLVLPAESTSQENKNPASSSKNSPPKKNLKLRPLRKIVPRIPKKS